MKICRIPIFLTPYGEACLVSPSASAWPHIKNGIEQNVLGNNAKLANFYLTPFRPTDTQTDRHTDRHMPSNPYTDWWNLWYLCSLYSFQLWRIKLIFIVKTHKPIFYFDLAYWQFQYLNLQRILIVNELDALRLFSDINKNARSLITKRQRYIINRSWIGGIIFYEAMVRIDTFNIQVNHCFVLMLDFLITHWLTQR